MMSWEHLLTGSQWIVAVAAALAAVVFWGARLFRGAARASRRVNEVFDIIAGRDAIVHPETGKVLAEATPGLGHRLATMESAVTSLAETHDMVATVIRRMDGQERRLDELEARVDDHIADCLRASEWVLGGKQPPR